MFIRLKGMFTTTLTLVQFNKDKETVIETDLSRWCIRGALMQYDDKGLLQPCAFFLKKNSLVECNYEIYNKEMLAII